MMARLALAFAAASGASVLLPESRYCRHITVSRAARRFAASSRRLGAIDGSELEMLTRQARNELPTDLVQCAENYQAVIGKAADMILLPLWSDPELDRRWLESWKGVRRGSDVFIKGWGAFDIIDACQLEQDWEYLELNHQMALDSLSDEGRRKVLEFVGVAEEDVLHRGVSCLACDYSQSDDLFFAVFRLGIDSIESEYLKDEVFRNQHVATSTLKEKLEVFLFLNRYLASWACSVPALQVGGYFGTSHDQKYEIGAILSAQLNCPVRQHFIEYVDSWARPQNMASLHELHTVSEQRRKRLPYSWPEGWESMQPEQLLNRIREMERERRKPDLAEYPHLDDLPDQGRLRVLRSGEQVLQAGIDLDNCALSFANSVKNQRAVLVVLDRKSNLGKPMALGMIYYDSEGMMDDWEQIYLKSNRVAPEAVKRLFYGYESTLRKWHNQRYMSESVSSR